MKDTDSDVVVLLLYEVGVSSDPDTDR